MITKPYPLHLYVEVAISYSAWSSEDLEIGDTDDKGWEIEYEDGLSLREAVEIFLQLSDNGEVHPSCSPMCTTLEHCWFTTYANDNNGKHYEYALHLKNVSPSSRKRLARKVFKINHV